MDEALDFLQSRPLIGFQMDGSHLNSVLQDILRSQQQLQQGQRQLADRLAVTEDDVKEVTSHVKDLESAVAELTGSSLGSEKLAQIRSRLDGVEHGLDLLLSDLNDTKKLATAAADDADAAGQLADRANRAALPLKEAVDTLVSDVDAFGRQHAQEQREMGRAINDMAESRAAQDRRFAESVRELQERVDRAMGDKGGGVERLRAMLEELSDRTDENFKSVEESARAVDSELTRQGHEVAAVRAEMAGLDERTRGRLSTLAGELDDRYGALLQAFKEYERNSQELEEHLVKAGQALARRRDCR